VINDTQVIALEFQQTSKNVGTGFRVSVAWMVLAGPPEALILRTSVANGNMG
jgi:hypothetical protein